MSGTEWRDGGYPEAEGKRALFSLPDLLVRDSPPFPSQIETVIALGFSFSLPPFSLSPTLLQFLGIMKFSEEVAAASELSLPAVGSAEEVRVRRKTLEAVLEQCHRALALLEKPEVDEDLVEEEVDEEGSNRSDFPSTVDYEAKELCNLLKSRVESPEFLEKLGSIHICASPEVSEDNTSWDMVSLKDVWDDKQIFVDNESEDDSYVLVRQEDIVDGIACFMAAYLLSLKDSKELTPNQLQEALCKTFSGKKKKSRLQKAWDGSKVIYNVASWSATAIGIYQNPALLRVATLAFSTSCRAFSKLL